MHDNLTQRSQTVVCQISDGMRAVPAVVTDYFYITDTVLMFELAFGRNRAV